MIGLHLSDYLENNVFRDDACARQLPLHRSQAAAETIWKGIGVEPWGCTLAAFHRDLMRLRLRQELRHALRL